MLGVSVSEDGEDVQMGGGASPQHRARLNATEQHTRKEAGR